MNPYAGYHHLPQPIIPGSGQKKKVAILGGGPAGLRAALFAAERGHDVTLYEKSDKLGGQLKFADHVSFKWNLKDYKDWMIREIEKSPVNVQLNTAATPELLKDAGYDVIIAAMGSTAQSIPVSGADAQGVWLAEDVFGREAELGHKVLVIGGGDTGKEAALYLAKAGHDTTMVTRKQAKLFEDLHAKRATELDFENEPNFHFIEHAKTVAVTPTQVTLDVTLGVPHQDVMFEMMDPENAGPKVPSVMPNARPEGFPQQRPLMPIHNDGTEKNGPGFAKPAPKVDIYTLPQETHFRRPEIRRCGGIPFCGTGVLYHR